MTGLSYLMLARGGWEAAIPRDCPRKAAGSRHSTGLPAQGGWKPPFHGSDGFLHVPDEGAEAEHRAVFVEMAEFGE